MARSLTIPTRLFIPVEQSFGHISRLPVPGSPSGNPLTGEVSDVNWRSLAALFQVGIILIWDFQTLIPPEQFQSSPISAVSVSSVDESNRLSTAQRQLLSWAEDRFGRAGLEFPEVDIRFHPDLVACDGHVGFFDGATKSLNLCRIDKKSILHELAHAWAHSNLTDRQRSEFTALRGLEAWNDHNLEWSERATEHAAETIAWALMDRNRLVPWVTKVDGIDHQTWRLTTIADSQPDQLEVGYEFLTGKRPVDRLADDPRLDPQPEPLSPESYRAWARR